MKLGLVFIKENDKAQVDCMVNFGIEVVKMGLEERRRICFREEEKTPL